MLRRTLVRLFGAGGLGALLPAPRAAAAPVDPLLALATAVLPASLGGARIESVVAAFRNWLRGYRPGADQGHGYGHVRLASAPPTPAEGHAAQLAALDTAAKSLGSASFAALPATQQKTLIADALRAAKVDRLPERPDGRHVAADLLAFFFRSSEANDLAYRAEIGRESCRGLPGSEARPAALRADALRVGQTAAPRVHSGS